VKYGFVYIWRDRKHKRFYIGSHWGTETDGYVCSSNWMKQAYRIRPQDFKRRIISKVFTSYRDLLLEEQHWLSMIDDEEICAKKYYNRTKSTGHWRTKDYEKDVKKRISNNTKAAMQKPEVREKYLQSLQTRNCRSSDPEVREKRRASMIKTMAKKFPVENRTVTVKLTDSERFEYYSKKAKKMWEDPDHKAKVSESISKSLVASKEHRSKVMSSMKWYNNGTTNTRKQLHPGDGWVEGKLK
jgi:hypothetical protein